MDYFKLYLQNYMREHGFDYTDINSDFVQVRADIATQTFEDQRKAGNSVCGSEELAIRDLFTGVGESIWDTAYDLLEEKFSDRIEISYPMIHDFWTQKLKEYKELWRTYALKDGIGLNGELVDKNRVEIIEKINQFLTTHGL